MGDLGEVNRSCVRFIRGQFYITRHEEVNWPELQEANDQPSSKNCLRIQNNTKEFYDPD